MSEPTVHSHSGGGLDVKLSEKVGPLNLGQWIGVLVAAGVVLWWWRRRHAPAGVVVGATGAGAGGAMPPTAIDNTMPGAGNLAGVTPSYVDGTAQQLGGTATNQSWITKAENALLAGGINPYQVDQVLQKYLAGQALTSTEQAIFNKAVQAVGPVPEPVAAMPGTGGAGAGLPGSGGGGGAGVAPPSTGLINEFDTPWAALIGGKYIDKATGRLAYYGPEGQPGSGNKDPAHGFTASWTMPDGRVAWYNPTSFRYSSGATNTAGQQYWQSLQNTSGLPLANGTGLPGGSYSPGQLLPGG